MKRNRCPVPEQRKAALKLVTLQANSWEWARSTFGTAPAEEGKDPAKAFANRFKIEGFLDQAATARAALADLFLCKANQLAAVDPAKIKAPALVLYAPNDLLFYEPIVSETLQKITEAGGSAESARLVGPNGHIDAFIAIGQGSEKIAAFSLNNKIAFL